MTSYEVSSLLLLFLAHLSWVSGLCSLDKSTAAQCHDLEDARYINTYHLHVLRAPSSSNVLTPGNFRNLTSLRHLDLSGGKIETIDSDSFAKLSFLQTLNLAENSIRHLEVGAFNGLKHLHSLKLGNNEIRQLPSALITLKELRYLDLSSNPLNCNCASMKLRDALLTRGVKISKKTQCSEPKSSKYAPILKPNTRITCEFEKQDFEMQNDQAIEDKLSHEQEEEEKVSKDAETDESIESEIDQLVRDESEEATAAPSISSDKTTLSTLNSSTTSTEQIFSSTPETKDDITFENTQDSSNEKLVTEAAANQSLATDRLIDSKELESGNDKDDDLILASILPKSTTEIQIDTSSISSKPEKSDDIIVPFEASGESDDDGSGSEGSGLISRMPAIDFNDTIEESENEEVLSTSTGATSTTTDRASWWDFVWNPFSSETTERTKSSPVTEKSPKEVIEEEEFIQVTSKPPVSNEIGITNEIVLPKVTPQESSTKKLDSSSTTTSKSIELIDEVKSLDIGDNALDSTVSQESKKGMGSYVVLGILLAVLTILIGVAACKGNFCKKKQKRGDLERGTELKDMQKTLLDQNSAQPKIQASNGNTMENVPLMNGSLPEEPNEKQRSYDVSPMVTTNGSSKYNGPTIEVNDPMKPLRKVLNHEVGAPLNGLNPPMDAIDAPSSTCLHHESNERLNNGDYEERPPLSPNAQRVMITMQENPDSVPKTPILITRVRDGENLVKEP